MSEPRQEFVVSVLSALRLTAWKLNSYSEFYRSEDPKFRPDDFSLAPIYMAIEILENHLNFLKENRIA